MQIVFLETKVDHSNQNKTQKTTKKINYNSHSAQMSIKK